VLYSDCQKHVPSGGRFFATIIYVAIRLSEHQYADAAAMPTERQQHAVLDEDPDVRIMAGWLSLSSSCHLSVRS
jgi:hypothetical protein